MAVSTMKSVVANSLYKFPIIVILGSTGVGKTKLSIELSKNLNGEVVSADSMQVYKGLDIITAKATQAERSACKHHMIDVVNPLDNFNVVQFRNMALPIINDISERGKVPIIVGGTNYYIESLLWNILVTGDTDVTKPLENIKSNEYVEYHVDDKQENSSDQEEETVEACSDREEKNEANESEEDNLIKKHSISADNTKNYELLKGIDPIAAARVHPNDTRKVKRQLEIWRKTGQLPSSLIKKQHSEDGADHLGGPLRFKNALVFWLSCDQAVLDNRICDRVESMLTSGLVEEISSFYSDYKSKLSEKPADYVPYTEGIFQAIGFKEFHKFLLSNTNDKNEKEKLLLEGTEALKRVTIKYSKKQKTWVQNRFLQRPMHSSPDVYQLDASDVEIWNETVLVPALEAAKCFLSGKKLSLIPLPRIAKDPNDDSHKQYICNICDEKLIVGDSTWKRHCQSRKHKKRAAKKRKLESSYDGLFAKRF